MDETDTLDPATLEIVRNKLGRIADEMQYRVMRSAYSPLWQEAGDLSAAILGPDGEVVGQSDRVIPVHVASMRQVVSACVDAVGGRGALESGDVFIQNDPYAGTLHLPNVTLAAPVFGDGWLLGFAAVQGHWVDIGGASTTSYDLKPDSEIVTEGIRIPPAKLYAAGERNDALLSTILANVRDPDERRGDMRAQLAGVRHGEDRLADLGAEHGSTTVRSAIGTILVEDEQRMRRRLAALPDGSRLVRDVVEGGDAAPGLLEVVAEVTIDGESAMVDFAGTADQVTGPINSSWSSTVACVHYGFKLTLDPGGPGTLGSYRPIEVTAPDGSLVNPTHPAPVVAQHSVGTRVYDLVVKAMGDIAPERAFGAGEGSSNVFSYRSLDTDAFNYTCTPGGLGACPGRDGVNGIRSGRGNTGSQPVERVEQDYDFVTVDAYRLVPDSGGAGRHRGGLGAERVITFADPTEIVVAGDRTKSRPFGVAGGGPGGASEHVLCEPEGDCRRLPPKTTTTMIAGSTVRYRTAGAGGCGDPSDRVPADVIADLRDGYITAEEARESYEVVVDPESQTLDRAATEQLRAHD